MKALTSKPLCGEEGVVGGVRDMLRGFCSRSSKSRGATEGKRSLEVVMQKNV